MRTRTVISLETKLKPWRLLRPGTRVQSLTYKRGQRGSIAEVLRRPDDPLNGLLRYGVRLDDDPANVADFCRYEFKALPRNT